MIFPNDYINKIIQGDCIEVMKNIPNESIDLILTDPPYNIGDDSKLTKVGNEFKTNKQSWGEWDNMDEKEYLDWIKKNVKEFYRLLKDSGSLIMFFDKFNITYLRDFGKEIGFHPVNFYALIKRNPVPNLRKNGFTSGFELGIIFNKNKKEKKWHFLNQNLMQNYFLYNIGQKHTKHPTEKPILAFEKLIQIFTDKNDLILDCWLGGGTTARACQNLQRNFIGIEINSQYCEIARERLRQHILL